MSITILCIMSHVSNVDMHSSGVYNVARFHPDHTGAFRCDLNIPCEIYALENAVFHIIVYGLYKP